MEKDLWTKRHPYSAYFGIDADIVWCVVKNKLPMLK